jgi:hypothetical protein
MPGMDEPTSDPVPKRRWLQFSLRKMLVAVALSALVVGWFGSQLNRARNRRHAIERIEANGGRVYQSGESAHPRPQWLLKLDRALGDRGELTAIVLPEILARTDAESVAKLFPESVIWCRDRIMYSPVGAPKVP